MVEQPLSSARRTILSRGYLDLGDGQLHYVRRHGDGAPIVFLHQTASSSRMWTKVMTRLHNGRPLWALDTPGFGASFDPPCDPTMADYSRWLGEAVDQLAGCGSVHLVGHHTGASIALAYAAANPARVHSLTLFGPAALTEEERSHYASRLGAPFRPNRSGAYLLKNWEYLRVGGADRDIELLHREMMDMMRGWASRPHAYRAVWEQDVAAQLRAIVCPLHLVSSPDDLLFGLFDRTCAVRPDARVTILSGGANFAPDLNADEVASALDASGFYGEAEGTSGQ
ncbi:MAG: alpha/beta fold hydrolase [Rhizorhabdus sp.]|uniref:alpha/beta fold hydrolase n=1 Tax=Rhizorhabdus sp. TaxID=1968843 RepID=UPI001B3F30C9|nr:alpha/beta hydrolase [Rhizorhabdus sp.]MBP8233017.1 alpha/beta fold hydrolase [Rhizorhabdus sp.]